MEVLGGNLLDLAVGGHPAAPNFVAQVLRSCSQESLCLRQSRGDDARLEVAREMLEGETGLSFGDESLAYVRSAATEGSRSGISSPTP